MRYQQFAYLYDELMKDAPYEEWVEFVKDRCVKYHVEGTRFLDLACGTGELSVRLAQDGFQVTGVDLSEDMLAVAHAKAEETGLRIPFFQQSMTDLEGQAEFDVIGILCDSLNYLQTEDEVRETFSNVFQHLSTKGIFLFDVHSIYKIAHLFINQTYASSEENVSFIWNSFAGKSLNSVEHELSFFVLDEQTGKYDRFDELHFQRTYTIQQYSNWLIEAGFEVLEVSADFENTDPHSQSERIFFVARKHKESHL
ncbi:methyltransferase domain-containing protein [Neobacillus sp. MER 74]|uniref:class I SAM-dependent DNA methyltransferase n=1 Tax=unclassified Neobacillus TaxID=2675272 RepID=UPI00203DD1D0|nr:class I SAM-dependent methyltransferase [Neobacillus sp. MER 74]MCM3114900.1 methyltransferase domain-containing protein [Neobacillus sp. MER 74]